MVYPTLLAAIGDVARGAHRRSACTGLWRDVCYAIGALLASVTADALGLSASMWVIAALMFASGLVVAFRMTETLARTARCDGVGDRNVSSARSEVGPACMIDFSTRDVNGHANPAPRRHWLH